MYSFKINYNNVNGGNNSSNFTYRPCPNCVPFLRKKILDIKNKNCFSYNEINNFIVNNFDQGLYSGLIKNYRNRSNYNIEHLVPFSLFSRTGRNNLNYYSCLPKNVEPFTDANIMFTTYKDTNTHRNNFILSENTQLNINRFNNSNVNIYLIKTNNNNLKTLYDEDYVKYINTKFNKENYKNVFKNNFLNDIYFNNTNIIKNKIKILNNKTKFITKDNNFIISDNDKITEINNWNMDSICKNKSDCIFSCDKSKCIFNPRFVSKGDISRSLNYFQLVYGYNPHNRDFEAENYYDIVDKENYKNNNNWLGNYDNNNIFVHFDDESWNDFYYNQLDMLYRWTNDDVLNEKEHDRNKKIAIKTGIANIFVGAYKDGEYITAEYSKDDTGRNWFKDLFLGNEHDCEFYKSLEVSPPNFYKKNIKINNIPQSTSSKKYIPPHLRGK
jgi:hypothetical protein